MKKCIGCGIELQNENPKLIGYTPKIESDYCQRCFRLTHYDDLTISMKQGIEDKEILDDIKSLDHPLICWIVDLFDFESNMIEKLNERVNSNAILMIGTKRDLLPETMSHKKIEHFVRRRVNELGIKIIDFVEVGNYGKEGKEFLLDAIKKYATNKKVVFVGKANAGKSTLMNSLLSNGVLTSSRYPGTTLKMNEIQVDDYLFYDTPGLENKASMLNEAYEKDLKQIMCYRTVKPEVYQCYSSLSFAMGGLARVDLTNMHGSAVFYRNELLKIHRGKMEKANALWEAHFNEELKPVGKADYKEYQRHTFEPMKEKFDIVICGLGWVSISGSLTKVDVYAPKGVKVCIRKAMI